jgi:hypothetical protein
MRKLAPILLLAACGGSSIPDRAAVTGKVAGTPLLAQNAAAIVVRTSGTPTVAVLISNLADGCNANATNVKDKQVLSLGVSSLSGSALAAGDFGVYDQQSGTIPSGTVVFADYHSSSAGCADTTPPNTLGASGHVTVTKMNPGAGGEVAGTFDLLLQNGDHLKGSFDAPVCGDRPDAGADAGCR